MRLDTTPQRFDVVPEKGSLIYSKADLPVKQKNKKSAPVNRLKDSLNSRDEQSHTVSRVQQNEVIQCINKKVKTHSKQQQCQMPVFNNKKCQAKKSVNIQPKKPRKDMQSNGSAMLIQHDMLKKQEIVARRPVKSKMCADKKCQATKYYKEIDKNCQAEKSVIMHLVKPQKDMQLKKRAAKDKNCQVIMCNKRQVPLSKDNSCKSTRVYRKSVCSDKNCQENENNVMQSVTKKMDVWLPKPVPYEYRRLCKDKKCQSSRCYKSPVRPM